MDSLSSEMIEQLRGLFGQMVESRRHLRPILSDIAASIDKGFFIDADSEEVTQLLKKILEVQEQLSGVEQLKRAANSKKLEQVDKSLGLLEQNCKRDEINSTLARISTLVVDSDDQAILDAVMKVKMQAEHLRNKSGKLEPAQFDKQAERFVLLVEIIDNAEAFSANDFLKISASFQDNPLIGMILTSHILHFPQPVEEEDYAEETPPPNDAKESISTEPTKHKLSAVRRQADKIQPDLSLVLVDEKNFTIEKATVKKLLTIKSFNNKVHELFDAVDPMPIFKVLIKTRIFFSEDPKDILVSGKLTKKIAALVPRIFNKLFSWGIVDKITWRGSEFYFLNDFGLDLCIRSFTHTSPPSPSEDYFAEMVSSMQFSIMLMSEARLKGDLKIKFNYNPNIPAARALMLSKEGTIDVILMFSLILLGEKWEMQIARFKLLIEHEIDSPAELKAVFLFAFSEKDLPWLKFFDTTKFKKIKFFMLTWDGLLDQDGNEVDLDNWKDICDISAPMEKPNFKNFKPKGRPRKNVSVEDILGFKAAKKPAAPKTNPQPKEPEISLFEFLANNKKVLEDETETAEISDTEIEEPVIDVVVDEPVVDVDTETETEIIFEPETETKIETVPMPPPEPEIEIVKTSDDDIVTADILTSVINLFKIGANGRGMLALHALKDYFSGEDDGELAVESLTKEIGFILDDPLTLRNLHNFDTFNFWTGGAEIPKANLGNTFDYLNLAATIKNFFAPANPTSYQLQKLWKQINEDKANSVLKIFPAAKNLISVFNIFTEKTHRAFADCLNEGGDTGENKFKAVLAQIENMKNIIENVLHSDVNHRRVKDVITQLFRNNGLARKYLDVDKFSVDEILDFCRRFEKVDLRDIVADANATIDDELFSEDKIGEFLDYIWDNPVVQLVRREHEPFHGPKRKKVTVTMAQLLTTLLSYVHAKKNLEISGGANKQSAPVDKALDILSDLKKQITRAEKRANLGHLVFRAFVENLIKRLKGEDTALNYNECLIGANYIELENNLPVMESFGVEEFSLKSRTAEFEENLRDKTFAEALRVAYEAALKNYDCGILQDLAKNYLAQLGTSEEDIKRKITGLERQVDKQIERIYNEFLNDLELARNYSRITDQEKIDFYINAVVKAKEHFTDTKNAGLFQRFVNACYDSINQASLPQRNALTKRLEKLEENLVTTLNADETLETRYPILANVRRQIDLMNLTVAEDYMNRLETEGINLLTELDVTGTDLRTLEDFLVEYEGLLRSIVNANGSIEGAYRQRAHVGSNINRLNRETQNALEFARAWQGIHSGQNNAIRSSIIDLLNHLGFTDGTIAEQNMDAINQKSYTVTFPEPIKTRNSYPHPFAIFGTERFTKGLEIIYLGANRDSADNIAKVLGDMTSERGTICFMDHAMTLPVRRSLAKSIKIDANLKNIIVIDKVMMLYLTRFDEANRGKKMLQVALPFARIQPYTSKGKGVVAPEMFIGRSEELDKIRDMSGPVFVYGGRQLGKSALLRQVRSLEHNPAQLNYAFFIDLKGYDATQTLKKIILELTAAKLIGEVDTWQDFSFEMHKLLSGQLRGVVKPKKLFLLFDESDAFLSSPDSEKAINVLRELLVAFSGQFKFVLAGVHKVIRFEQNSSFGNLSHISVLPFRPSDAMELLVKPMSYLGFRVADDSLISAIFSRTNYYPGLIQYYCNMLVDAVGNNYTKQNFNVTKNPPYTLDDDYLKNMLSNNDFQKEINARFQETLTLDNDNFYEILALAIAWIYYENNRPVSVEVSEIRNICVMCGVEKITRLTDAELLSLLDEMVALNLLRRVEGKFEFNRYAFWHMMGTETEVNEKLDSYGLNAE